MTATLRSLLESDLAQGKLELAEVRKALKTDRERFSRPQISVLYTYRRMLIAKVQDIEAQLK